MCFGRKKKNLNHDAPVSVKPVSPAASDDLSSAFQSLNIQNPPTASVPSIVTSYHTSPPPTKPLAKFPLSQARCRKCNWVPKYRNKVSPQNPNGNADRPYYICVRCRDKPDAATAMKSNRIRRENGWITWDDNIGISQENRLCFCGFVCRQDRAGVDSYYPGGGFWTCATGSCDFLSFRRDGLTDDEAYKTNAAHSEGFEPWLL